MEIHIPSDADTTAVRIEGSQEGVASAKAELLELVDKMVSSSCSSSCSSCSCCSCSCIVIVVVGLVLAVGGKGQYSK